jgi:hypothetical protein
MYQRPAAPNTIGGVIDDSIRLYKSTIRTWWLPSVLLTAVATAVTILMLARLGANLAPADMLATYRDPKVLLVYLAMLAFSEWMYVFMIANMSAVASGEELSLGGGFARSVQLLPATLGASVLFALCVTGATLLLILPGIWVFGQLLYWPVALVVERTGPGGALAASWRNVKGYWWRTSTILTVLFIMIIVLSMVVTFVAGVLVGVLHTDAATALVAIQIASGVARVFTTPLFCAALVAVYLDLKLRREGADLEARVRDLKPA